MAHQNGATPLNIVPIGTFFATPQRAFMRNEIDAEPTYSEARNFDRYMRAGPTDDDPDGAAADRAR